MRFELETSPIANNYQTEKSKPAWFYRTFPTMGFYSRAADVVFSGASKAKKGLYDDREWAYSSLRVFQGLERSGVQFEIENLQSVLNTDGPCVIVGNHMSTLETFVMPFMIAPHRPVTFVVKKSLVEYPVFKHIMRSRNPIVVGRENPRDDLRAMLNGGLERLKAGISLIVYPQTTRMVEFDAENFNSIGVKIAKKAGVPVVPLALKTDAWANGKILKDFGKISPEKRVRFSFGEAMNVEGNGAAQQGKIVQFIQSKLNDWKDA